jgi:hypothetical protein
MIIYTRNITFLTLLFFASMLGESNFAYAQYPGFDAPDNRISGTVTGLVAVNSEINGGAIPTGATAQIVVLFRNEGAQPVTTGMINLYPSSNISASVSLNQCEAGALESGAECALAISVKGLQSGPWRLEMLMRHSGRSRLVTTTLSGTVDTSGDSADRLSSDIETIPNEIDFGSLESSQTIVESVILRNITSEPIKLSEVFIKASEGSGYSVEADCEELQAGQACIATIRWAPTQRGPSTGVLVVKHDGPTALASVALEGEYSPDKSDEATVFPDAVPGRGLLVSSQEEVDFGSGITSASTITVSLVNTGDSPVTFKNIKIAGSDNGLSLNNEGCAADLVLQPIEACPLTVTWSPTRVGSLLDDIQVRHDGARGVLVLPVRGNAESKVSQDQKAIVLQMREPTRVIGSDGVVSGGEPKVDSPKVRKSVTNASNVANASSALDGFKITSFSSNRAIVNGPSGSRLIHNNEAIVLGGIQWDIAIEKNGIEFASGDDRILLLFDRSLSSVNRNGSKSSQSTSSDAE